jgi:tetratricopeptide (TPR) repeat protein
MLKAVIRFSLIIVCVGLLNYFVNAQEFKNVDEAVEALENKDWNVKGAAADYLVENQKESVPILKKLIKNKQSGWITAIWTLTKTKVESVLPFYIKLLEKNFYNKDKNGERIIYGFGSPYGCIGFPNQYGGILAYHIGEIGDEGAIPVLREALKQGDKEVKENAYFALYKLKDISIEDFFDIADTEKEVKIVSLISRIGLENIHSNTNFAIETFDRIIQGFPQERYEVASAHFWKIQCFELLKQYDKALQECDEVLKFPDFENLTIQANQKKEKLLLEGKPLKKS